MPGRLFGWCGRGRGLAWEGTDGAGSWGESLVEVVEQLPDQLGRCPGGGSADGGGEDGADAAGQFGRGHVAVGGVEGVRIEQADQGVFGVLLLPRSAFRGCAAGCGSSRSATRSRSSTTVTWHGGGSSVVDRDRDRDRGRGRGRGTVRPSCGRCWWDRRGHDVPLSLLRVCCPGRPVPFARCDRPAGYGWPVRRWRSVVGSSPVAIMSAAISRTLRLVSWEVRRSNANACSSVR